jgi:hypothetical protein
MVSMSSFARTIYEGKYAMKQPDGKLEDWHDTARRVVSNVLAALAR